MSRNQLHRTPSRGRYFMARGWQQHPVFPPEPFTSREAWEWLIAEAFWREGRARIGHSVSTLQRGQLAASIRYLASCWQWEKGRVERFLRRLKTETMIETRTETGISVISICNYEKYQSFNADSETATGTSSETPPRQRRDKKEINQDKYTNKDSEESFSLFAEQAAPPAPHKKSADPPYSPEFEAFWSAYPRHNGSKKEAFKFYQRKIKKGIPHGCIIEGAKKYRTAQDAKGGGKDYVRHACRWLDHECWDNDYTIDTSARANTASMQRKGATSYIDATRRIIEERNEREARLEEPPHP